MKSTRPALHLWLYFITTLSLIFVFSCSSGSRQKNAIDLDLLSPRMQTPGLSMSESRKRKNMVEQIDYGLSLNLVESEKIFSGQVSIDLKLRSADNDLTIDFADGNILSVEVNGATLANPGYNGIFLTIPRQRLNEGQNKIFIHFRHDYSTTGMGLYRFKDPVDGMVYLYTQFEPFSANEMFPCFDQPDLKATFKLEVKAPRPWTVISATAEKSISKLDGGTNNLWSFSKTPLLSPYVFSLHAGPYKKWQSQAGDIPLRLFARQSIAKFVHFQEWFLITKQGLGFFNKYFNFQYPFKKYDQIVVPDFNAGAMENVAAITFSERFIIRSKSTKAQRENLAAVILHEMAHMWFGDLVTMEWWNGLWLNESFATYLEFVALVEATEFKQAWLTFYSRYKQRGYREDQLVTTHPIDVPVVDTETAFVNFDGITYSKGASVLKQLSHYLKKNKFRDGVRIYLKKHAYGNASLEDFMAAQEQSSGIKLGEWSRQWLQESGVNTVKIGYECDQNSRIQKFFLQQSPPARNRISTIGLLELRDKNKVGLGTTTSVGYNTLEVPEVPSLVGATCPPLMVYPNIDDHDFVKVELDPYTIKSAQQHLSGVQDPLLRAMLWQAFWDMVWDAKWPVTSYVDLILKHLGTEQNTIVLNAVLSRIPSVLKYLPSKGEPFDEQGLVFTERLEAFLWQQAQKAKPGTDHQKAWFDTFIKSAPLPWVLNTLEKVLRGLVSINGLVIDQDRRWDILIKLAGGGVPSAAELIDEELKKDPSDLGAKMALAARAAMPSKENKEKWFTEVSDPNSTLSLTELRHIMEGLFPRNQAAVRIGFGPQYFTSLSALSKIKKNDFTSLYTSLLMPADCSIASLQNLSHYIADERKHLPASALKPLRIAEQEEQKCIDIRKLAGW